MTSILRRPAPAAWEHHIQRFRLELRSRGLRPRSVTLRVSHIERIARIMDGAPEEVSQEDLAAWCGNQEWAIETRHCYYTSFKQFFGYLWKDQPTKDPAMGLKGLSRPVQEPRPTSEAAIHAALQKADELEDKRTSLMILLGARLGLRIGEIVQVHQDDIIEDVGGLSLIVNGKGGKTRNIPLTQEFGELLQTWSHTHGGWAFPGKINGHLSPQWASTMVSSLLPGPWTTHTLRHRFATQAYAVDRDILVVQKLLGHASVATTMRYARPPRSAMNRALAGASLRATPPTPKRIFLEDQEIWIELETSPPKILVTNKSGNLIESTLTTTEITNLTSAFQALEENGK